MRFFPDASALRSPRTRITIAFIFLAGALAAVPLLGIDTTRLNATGLKNMVLACGIWGPLAYVGLFMIRPVMMIPASVFVAAAGAVWGTIPGFLLSLAAAMSAATVEFFVARLFAREAVAKLLRGRMQAVDQFLKKKGILAVVLLRLFPPLPFDIMNLALAVTGIRFRVYFWATLFGIMPASFLLVYFGDAVLSAIVTPRQGGRIALAILLLAGMFYFGCRWRQRQKRCGTASAGQE